MKTRPTPAAHDHGDLEEIFNDVFFVTGSMSMGPMRFSRNMVVVRQGERLVIVNSMRLSDAGLAALDALGKVSDVIRLAGFHGSDDPFYKQRYGAKIWAMAGQTYFTGLDPGKGEVYFEADGYLESDSALPIADARLTVLDTKPSEGLLLLDVGGGTLITGDAMQNWSQTNRYFNWIAKLAMPSMGFIKPTQLGPGWVKGCKPKPAQMQGILELPFDNVLPAHGSPVLGGARERYRPAIEGYVARRQANAAR